MDDDEHLHIDAQPAQPTTSSKELRQCLDEGREDAKLGEDIGREDAKLGYRPPFSPLFTESEVVRQKTQSRSVDTGALSSMDSEQQPTDMTAEEAEMVKLNKSVKNALKGKGKKNRKAGLEKDRT